MGFVDWISLLARVTSAESIVGILEFIKNSLSLLRRWEEVRRQPLALELESNLS